MGRALHEVNRVRGYWGHANRETNVTKLDNNDYDDDDDDDAKNSTYLCGT